MYVYKLAWKIESNLSITFYHRTLSYGYYMNNTSTVFSPKQCVEFVSLLTSCTSSDNSVAKPCRPLNLFHINDWINNIFSHNAHILSSLSGNSKPLKLSLCLCYSRNLLLASISAWIPPNPWINFYYYYYYCGLFFLF